MTARSTKQTFIMEYGETTYIAERCRKGAKKLRWSAMPTHKPEPDKLIEPRRVPLSVRHWAKEWQRPARELSPLRKRELAADRRDALRSQQVQGLGDPTWSPGVRVATATTEGLAKTFDRQLALYAASIGQRRGLLPTNLNGWVLARRDDCNVVFEQRDGERYVRTRLGRKYLPGGEYVPHVAYAVNFDLSAAALFDWPQDATETLDYALALAA